MIEIEDGLAIDEGELAYEFARASGPGGQNVNKVETKVTVTWSVRTSDSVSEEQRAKIEERLATRITKDGVLRVTSSKHRTREANRRAALARFADLLGEALEEAPERKPTRVPKAAKRRRLENKKRRSEKKRLREPPRDDW